MQRTVTGAGSLLLRGLGPSGLLVSRGLGGNEVSFVITVDRPRQLRVGGGSGRREERLETDKVNCYFVNVKLVMVNDQVLLEPIEGAVKVCYGVDRFRVTSTLPRVSRRRSRLVVRMRLVTGNS